MDFPPLVKSADLILHNTAQSVPIEDLKPGMTIHSGQRYDIPCEKIYNLARLGMSTNLIATSNGMDYRTLEFHFKRTITQARQDAAQEHLARMQDKARDEMTKGDMAAMKFLLNRLDPEPKEAPVIIQQNFVQTEQIKSINPDDYSDLIINS